MKQQTPDLIESNPQVGVSACALGQPVRYNGGHKQSKICLEVLDGVFDMVPVCPEVAVGLGVPRKPIRLVQTDSELGVKAVGTVNPDLDVTDPLYDYGVSVAEANPRMAGFISLQGSPSCGSHKVKVYLENGYPAEKGSQGLFIRGLRSKLGCIPIEESGRLNDPQLRENFVTRVMVYQRWLEALDPSCNDISIADCVHFYSTHKYLLMAHRYESYKSMGRLLAEAGKYTPEKLSFKILEGLMAGLSYLSNHKSHANTLMHLMGYLKKVLSAQEKQEMVTLIDQYRKETVPLIAPVTLLNHHMTKLEFGYPHQQVYLQPYPYELGLRNQI